MKTLRSYFWLPLLVAPLGCGDDTDEETSGGDAGPVYVFMTQVYTAEDRTVYLKVTESLDVGETALSIDDAQEFPSVANFAAIAGKLYVSSGESKTITDYEVTPSLKWSKGVTLDFSNYPLDDNANFHYQYILGENRVVLPFEVTGRLIWDPEQMRITDTLDDTAVPFEQDGLTVASDGNRSATRFPTGPFRQPFHTLDVDDLYGEISYIASYDDELRESSVIVAPCPALERVTLAEDGTTYFSSQWSSPFRHLFGVAPAPCAVRVSPDGDLDEDWTTDFTDLTGGRFVMNFRYLRGGKAIGNVLYHEELGVDFEGEYDSAIEDLIVGRQRPNARVAVRSGREYGPGDHGHRGTAHARAAVRGRGRSDLRLRPAERLRNHSHLRDHGRRRRDAQVRNDRRRVQARAPSLKRAWLRAPRSL